MVSTPITFSDIQNHWSRPFAFDLSDAGIIFKAVYLRKDDITTQAETLKMALRSARVDTSETNSPSYYTNISEDDWVKNYANTAYDLHILNIPIGSHYEKNAGITRKDALILFMKAFKIIPDSHLQSGFTDIHDSTLESYAAKAKSLGIVKGTRENSFEPDRFMTRAEMVKFASLFRHTSSL